jgi:RNA polymerase sigma-70 factor (ECF subfamily)
MTTEKETELLLRKLAEGDTSAGSQLLRCHRERLKQMVAMRFDRRLRGRFDPSDVVQEALVIANDRLASYVQQKQIAFYPWLRGIAWEQLLKFHEKHIHTEKRAIDREEPQGPTLNDESINELADRLVGAEGTPSEDFIKVEQQANVRQALKSLRLQDRKVIELHYMEHLDYAEIAAVLNIRVSTVRTRHFRAVQRLHHILQGGNQS